ncbi:hypothetical protein R1flu_004242 [Riccia fluitans]|uniref:Uncharacterized protein n=1 Tax=Riccia fluitans TaxID=41844 RepID=A0ABD1YPQ3_9MARC
MLRTNILKTAQGDDGGKAGIPQSSNLQCVSVSGELAREVPKAVKEKVSTMGSICFNYLDRIERPSDHGRHELDTLAFDVNEFDYEHDV